MGELDLSDILQHMVEFHSDGISVSASSEVSDLFVRGTIERAQGNTRVDTPYVLHTWNVSDNALSVRKRERTMDTYYVPNTWNVSYNTC